MTNSELSNYSSLEHARLPEVTTTEHDALLTTAALEVVKQIDELLSHAEYRSLKFHREAVITPAKPSCETSIAHGTVRMEDHPDFEKMLSWIESIGYRVVLDGNAPHVVCRKVIHEQGGSIVGVTYEKELHVVPGMRFLDLEHEVGHIEQIEERLWTIPEFCTQAYREIDGVRIPVEYTPGMLTSWQDKITECHNRLVEFIRLAEREVDEETLIEHLIFLEKHFIAYQRKGVRYDRSPTQRAWRNQYFPDLHHLVDCADKIIYEKNLRRFLRGRGRK